MGVEDSRGQSVKRPLYKRLYAQVLVAIAVGVILGHFAPDVGILMQPLGVGFIKLIKMLIGPIIFCTVVSGIAKMGDLKGVGRVGLKAIVYFELTTTCALIIGLIVVNIIKPGAGIHATPDTMDQTLIAGYAANAKALSFQEHILHIIPDTFVDAFASGEILQVLLVAILVGVVLANFGDKGKRVVTLIDEFGHVFFGVIGMIMVLAPLGAFGAMAFTVAKYGVGSLGSLGQLLASVYITCILFVILVLGAVARFTGFSIWKFLRYIKEEIFIVIGTSSSETVLPRMMAKLENLGASKPVVGLAIPTGYSFNLDGTSIYLTMAAIFLAQATDTALTLGHQVQILLILLLTSKGAAAVTGGGFVTLAATLGTVGHIPVASLALILGIDRFMSEARAVTNLVGNGVATLFIAKWEKALDDA